MELATGEGTLDTHCSRQVLSGPYGHQAYRFHWTMLHGVCWGKNVSGSSALVEGKEVGSGRGKSCAEMRSQRSQPQPAPTLRQVSGFPGVELRQMRFSVSVSVSHWMQAVPTRAWLELGHSFLSRVNRIRVCLFTFYVTRQVVFR